MPDQSVHIGFHKEINTLVNIQVEINRAVWAANVTDIRESNFATEKDRDYYVQLCINNVFEHLKKLVPSQQLKFDF